MVSSSDLSEPACIFGTLAAAALAKYAFGAYTRWQKLQRFEVVGKVSGLTVFPVKSCAGIPVDEGVCTKLGLRVQGVTDRHWMIVKPNGDFMSQRQTPKMALIKVSLHGYQLFLDAPGMPTLKLPINPPLVRSQVTNCRVWECDLEGLHCGQEAGQWVSKFLEEEGLHIVFSAPELYKKDTSDFDKPWGNPALTGDQSAYSDCCAYLVLTDDSVDCLNTKLTKTVPAKVFRPNIVIKANKAFDEDMWQEIRIGEDAYMRMLDSCTRCVMTTVDPEKGEKSKDGEPLRTLRSFRCFPEFCGSPIFGVNGAVDREGTVKVGDPVYAIRK